MGKLQIETTYNVGFGSVTISLVDLPLYGEGRNLDETVEDLLNTILEFTNVYLAETDIFRSQWTKSQLNAMDLILDCDSEKERIMNLIPKSYMSIR